MSCPPKWDFRKYQSSPQRYHATRPTRSPSPPSSPTPSTSPTNPITHHERSSPRHPPKSPTPVWALSHSGLFHATPCTRPWSPCLPQARRHWAARRPWRRRSPCRDRSRPVRRTGYGRALFSWRTGRCCRRDRGCRPFAGSASASAYLFRWIGGRRVRRGREGV